MSSLIHVNLHRIDRKSPDNHQQPRPKCQKAPHILQSQ